MSSDFDPKGTLGLWEAIMRNADPEEVLRALSASSRGVSTNVTATGEHAVVIHGCTVTIHQTINHASRAENLKGESDAT
jgi:hypothetical protein